MIYNICKVVPNYDDTDCLEEILDFYSNTGYKLVSSVIGKNKYFSDVMYLFFTKEE